ncbi:hypothetical protein N3K66_006546 [Trichothecium roseum]|uniref:Uncharacterized protein n=1 Tax=Trichothecium roseum TaxID=47278 RepID=A0ACC0UWU9_9HYPO|nr:hypothetical protein N3K66_006546 [Trichothecium roseum]
MRLVSFITAALAIVPGAFAVDQTKSAIVWFDDANTPDSIIQKAKDDIISAGGKITHTYSIIKGFAVVAPEQALQVVQTWGTEHAIRVEEDEVVSIDN